MTVSKLSLYCLTDYNTNTKGKVPAGGAAFSRSFMQAARQALPSHLLQDAPAKVPTVDQAYGGWHLLSAALGFAGSPHRARDLLCTPVCSCSSPKGVAVQNFLYRNNSNRKEVQDDYLT